MCKQLLFVLSIGASSSGVAHAADPVGFERQGRCDTDETDPDGMRHACDIEVCYQAPEGAFIDEATLAVSMIEGHGSKVFCSPPYVERRTLVPITLPNGMVVTVEFPTEACVWGHALSPKGSGDAGHGWVTCLIAGEVRPFS